MAKPDYIDNTSITWSAEDATIRLDRETATLSVEVFLYVDDHGEIVSEDVDDYEAREIINRAKPLCPMADGSYKPLLEVVSLDGGVSYEDVTADVPDNQRPQVVSGQEVEWDHYIDGETHAHKVTWDWNDTITVVRENVDPASEHYEEQDTLPFSEAAPLLKTMDLKYVWMGEVKSLNDVVDRLMAGS